MALANYTDLQASIAGWLNRSDLTTAIPDFIVLAEAELSARLRCPQNETMDTAFAVTGRYTALPSDFAEMRRVFLNDSVRTELLPLTQAGGGYVSDVPKFYNVIAQTLEVVPLSTAYTLEMTYWTRIPALATNTTNDVLTAYPDLYLYACILQAGLYLTDDLVIGKYGPLYERSLAAANARRYRQMGSGLQVRAS